MIKKTLKYIDIDGVEREEDFYFNLTKAEILELQVSRVGGFAESMEALVRSNDKQQILHVIKEIILKSYGERSTESRHFIKRPEHAEAFSHTEAFSNLFMELFQDSRKAAEFFEGLMPQDLMKQVLVEQNARVVAQTPTRIVPQDHLQKVAPTVTKVTDVELEPEKAQDRPEEPPTMTQKNFLELPADEAQAFIRRGGKINFEM